MNKKGISDVIATLLIVLLALASFFIVWLYIIDLIGENFTITKTGCKTAEKWTEGCIPSNLLCAFSSDEKECYLKIKKGIEGGLFRSDSGTFGCIYARMNDEEVCEQVEVDELPLDCNPKNYNADEYPILCSTYRYCEFECLRLGYNYIPVFKDDPEEYECDCKIPMINKKDLTREKLEEIGAGCIECDTPQGLEGCDWISSGGRTGKNTCSKWKIGEYLIESK